MDRRTFGLRNGYRIEVSSGHMSPQEVARHLFGSVASGGLGSAVLMRNGGRLHLDPLSQPGYATPDCGSASELVVHDKAGDRILEGLLADAGQDVRVVKTNGCQEEYWTGRRGEFGRLADILIPFLVTRQLICGAGAVVQTPRGALYCLSSPAPRPRSRPLINTRDEPDTAAAGVRRLRVIVSDSSMSETTTLLKAGATDLVLRMAEAGTRLPDLTLDKPVEAIGEVSRDITGRCLVRLTRGREISALDIQREYLATAKDFTDRHGADAATVRVLGLWQRALDAIATGNLDAIGREIDWVIKYQLIEQYRAAHDLPLSSPRVADADLAYHDIDRHRGLFYQLQRDGKVDRTARDIDIFEAKTVPPVPVRYRRAG